ncbi:MAG: hypothetical protein AB7I04_18920 [Pseudomonadales bacterium]
MRKHLLLLLLTLPASVFGQTLECSACRDVRQHPTDFGNHVFNETFVIAQTYGATILNVNATVKNKLGQTAVVYLSRVLEDSGLNLGIPPFFYYQVPYPSPYVQIAVQDAWGTLTTYQVLISSRPLIVGDYEEAQEPAAVESSPPSNIQGTNVGSEPLPGSYTQNSYPYSMYGSWLAPTRERHYALQ